LYDGGHLQVVDCVFRAVQPEFKFQALSPGSRYLKFLA